MRKLFVVALSLVATACGSTESSDPSGDGGSMSDGASVTNDAGASMDGGGGDASTSLDGGTSADGGTGADGGTSADGGTGACPAPPGGLDAQTTAAYTKVMNARAAMGLPCATMVPAINAAATNHCGFYVTNRNDTNGCSTVDDPHSEVAGCPMFTGVEFGTRMTHAGYSGSPRFECMAFSNDGAAAVQQWIDSVWHRTPLLSPWVRDFGYGHGSGCDTMDFGVGATTPTTVVATYPYAGQTEVPRSFDGRYEGPTPPAPPSGWPSGYPITIYLAGTVATHTLRVDGSTTDIAHHWLAPSSYALLDRAYVMYAHAPLAAGTTYRVHVEGSRSGSPVTIDFTFTTK